MNYYNNFNWKSYCIQREAFKRGDVDSFPIASKEEQDAYIVPYKPIGVYITREKKWSEMTNKQKTYWNYIILSRNIYTEQHPIPYDDDE